MLITNNLFVAKFRYFLSLLNCHGLTIDQIETVTKLRSLEGKPHSGKIEFRFVSDTGKAYEIKFDFKCLGELTEQDLEDLLKLD